MVFEFECPLIVHEEPRREDYADSPWFVYKRLRAVWWRTIHSERQNHRCCYCGKHTVEVPERRNSATLDHIIPRADGGADSFENTIMACLGCNQNRGTKPVEEWLEVVLPYQDNLPRRMRSKVR